MNDLFKNDDVPSGAFSYTARDQSGAVIVEGWFTLDYQGLNEYKGEWHFEKIGNPQDIGPQVGEGELVGFQDSISIQINLNPQMADNNVILIGEMKGNEYTGVWQWVTFIGPTSTGGFEAVKR